MIVAFLKCVKLGIYICLIDILYLKECTLPIIENVQSKIIFKLEYFDFQHRQTLSLSEIKSICMPSKRDENMEFTMKAEDTVCLY